jgi:hypothetical protein
MGLMRFSCRLGNGWPGERAGPLRETAPMQGSCWSVGSCRDGSMHSIQSISMAASSSSTSTSGQEQASREEMARKKKRGPGHRSLVLSPCRCTACLNFRSQITLIMTWRLISRAHASHRNRCERPAAVTVRKCDPPPTSSLKVSSSQCNNCSRTIRFVSCQ